MGETGRNGKQEVNLRMKHELSLRTKNHIEERLGMSIDQIINTDVETLDRHIADRIGVNEIPIADVPLLRPTESIEEVDRKLKKI